jgi:hypothetical protein
VPVPVLREPEQAQEQRAQVQELVLPARRRPRVPDKVQPPMSRRGGIA